MSASVVRPQLMDVAAMASGGCREINDVGQMLEERANASSPERPPPRVGHVFDNERRVPASCGSPDRASVQFA